VINDNLGFISHRFRDMASFSLKTHIFLPHFYSTINLQMFSLHEIAEILHA